jgi:hypothetical protein
MISRRACPGRWRQLLGTIVLLAVVLTPGISVAADLTIDGGTVANVGGNITFTNEIIGDLSGGTLNQGAFTNTVTNDLTLGNTATGNGTYNLSGGTLTGSKIEFIGLAGTGTFSQTGPTFNDANIKLVLGSLAGSSGTYALNAPGSMVVGPGGLIVGDAGSGSFTQSGDIITLSGGIIVGNQTGSSGSYDLTAGTIGTVTKPPFETIGLDSSGAFTQSGGINWMTGALTLGFDSGGSGTYHLINGQLTALTETIGNSGSGAFTLSGGTNTVTGSLTLGLQGDSRGAFTQTGGSNAVTINLILGSNDVGASGTYSLSAGSLTVSGAEIIGNSGSGPSPRAVGAIG